MNVQEIVEWSLDQITNRVREWSKDSTELEVTWVAKDPSSTKVCVVMSPARNTVDVGQRRVITFHVRAEIDTYEVFKDPNLKRCPVCKKYKDGWPDSWANIKAKEKARLLYACGDYVKVHRIAYYESIWVTPHHGGCSGRFNYDVGKCENPQCSYKGGEDD